MHWRMQADGQSKAHAVIKSGTTRVKRQMGEWPAIDAAAIVGMLANEAEGAPDVVQGRREVVHDRNPDGWCVDGVRSVMPCV